jgi:CheY-like chemotaxis protein
LSEVQSHKGAILVVDDEEEIRLVLDTLLTDAGYYVRTAVGGEDALDMLKAEPADVIVVDYRMPEMDGLEFLEATWTFFPKPKTIMLTGNASIDMAMEAVRHGVVTIVSKPFVATEFLRLIACTMDEAREVREKSFESASLRRESEDLLAETRRFFTSIKNQMNNLISEPADISKADSKTFGYGSSGLTKLAHQVSIIDLKFIDKESARSGIFVDDGQKAVLLTLINSLCPDGKTIKLKPVSGGITFGKLFPVSLLHPNYLHFRDGEGNILNDISCLFSFPNGSMSPLADPYEVLEVDCNSTSDEVTAAYQKISAILAHEKSSHRQGDVSVRNAKVNEAYKRVRQHLRNLEANFDL